MIRCESGWTTKDGLHLHARCWQPDGEVTAVVCLVHGLGEHGDRYAHLADFLTDHGDALFSFDLRGHGRSGGARGHSPAYDSLMDDVADCLAEAVRTFPDKPLFLYGHSLGGNLALNYGLRRQPALAGLIATGPELRLAFQPSGATLALGKILYRVMPSLQLANGLNPQWLSHDQGVVSAYGADPLVHDRISARLALDLLQAGDWALQHAGEWTLPLLLMHGEADPICSVSGSRDFAAAAGPACTLKVWPGLYHEIHNEHEQQQVFDYLLPWLHART
jgi:acylglycerol lipase